MADRVNIKVDKDTRRQLKQYKRPRENWDHFLFRAVKALEQQRAGDQPYDPGGGETIPKCLSCDDPTAEWALQVTGVICAECSDIDIATECEM